MKPLGWPVTAGRATHALRFERERGQPPGCPCSLIRRIEIPDCWGSSRVRGSMIGSPIQQWIQFERHSYPHWPAERLGKATKPRRVHLESCAKMQVLLDWRARRTAVVVSTA